MLVSKQGNGFSGFRNLWHLWMWTFIGLGGLPGFCFQILGAQPLAGEIAATSQTDTTLPTRLASITTDTGDFAPGHREFSRYSSPDLCHAAVVWTRIVLRRSLAAQADSLRYLAVHDTVGAAGVAAVARACSAQVPAAAATSDLPTMIQLAVDQQDLAQARALLARFFAQHPAAFNHRLQATLVDYSLTEEHPANVAVATALVAQLDSLDASAVNVQLTAHLHLLDFWQHSADSARIRQEAMQILRMAHAAPAAPMRNPNDPAGAAADSAVVALIRLDLWAAPDSLPADFRRFCQAALIPTSLNTMCGHETLAELQPGLIASGILPGNVNDGRLAVPIKADFWFPTPGGDTVVPARGRVSLFVFPYSLPRPIADPTGDYGNALVGVLQESVQRWIAHYGSRGFQVTALTVTHGHAVLRGFQPPAEEARTIRWYVQDYLRLPITVAVITTPVHQLPSPDDRIVWERDELKAYGPMGQYVSTWGKPEYQFMLIDQTGKVVVAADDPGIIEEGLKILFPESLAAPSPRSSSVSSPQSLRRP